MGEGTIKTPDLIIAFERNYDALVFARAAEGAGVAGRMGPVPRRLQTSCGLAWYGEAEAFERAMAVVKSDAVPSGKIIIEKGGVRVGIPHDEGT